MLKRTKPLIRKSPMRHTSPKPRVVRSLRPNGKKRPPTPAEKEHMGKVAALGCWVCRKRGIRRAAIIHHIRDGYKTSQRAPHWETLPLCPDHHRNDGVFGIAFHAGTREWVKNFGRERDLLDEVLVEIYGPNPGPDEAPAPVRVLMKLAQAS